jgi:hypothetical protein
MILWRYYNSVSVLMNEIWNQTLDRGSSMVTYLNEEQVVNDYHLFRQNWHTLLSYRKIVIINLIVYAVMCIVIIIERFNDIYRKIVLCYQTISLICLWMYNGRYTRFDQLMMILINMTPLAWQINGDYYILFILHSIAGNLIDTLNDYTYSIHYLGLQQGSLNSLIILSLVNLVSSVFNLSDETIISYLMWQKLLFMYYQVHNKLDDGDVLNFGNKFKSMANMMFLGLTLINFIAATKNNMTFLLTTDLILCVWIIVQMYQNIQITHIKSADTEMDPDSLNHHELIE